MFVVCDLPPVDWHVIGEDSLKINKRIRDAGNSTTRWTSNQFLHFTLLTNESTDESENKFSFRDLPVANIFQVVGDVVDHFLSEVFEFRRFHVDLKSKTFKFLHTLTTSTTLTRRALHSTITTENFFAIAIYLQIHSADYCPWLMPFECISENQSREIS